MRGAAAQEVDGDDLADAGMAPEEIERLRAVMSGTDGVGQAGGDVSIFPGNVLAVEVFLTQERRWRYTPGGDPDGLDMAQVEATLNLLGVKRKRRAEVFWKLRTMERAAIEEMRQ